jgi:hypothetical protein
VLGGIKFTKKPSQISASQYKNNKKNSKKKFSDFFPIFFWAINILSGLSSSTTAKRGHYFYVPTSFYNLF